MLLVIGTIELCSRELANHFKTDVPLKISLATWQQAVTLPFIGPQPIIIIATYIKDPLLYCTVQRQALVNANKTLAADVDTVLAPTTAVGQPLTLVHLSWLPTIPPRSPESLPGVG